MTALPQAVVGHRELQHRILERIVRGDDLLEILNDLCRFVGAGVPDSVGSVMLPDEESGALEFFAAPELPPEALDEFSGLVPGDLACSCGTAFHQLAPVLVQDTLTDERWASKRAAAERFGIRACWSIPILREGIALGTFGISRLVPGAPSPEQWVLLETAAHLAGMAIGRAEDGRRLEEQGELLEFLLKSVSDGVFAKDLEGRYLLANQTEACAVSLTPQEMIGRTDAELYESELAELARTQDLQVIESGESLDYCATYPNTELGERTYLVRKSPLLDGGGRVRGVVGIARDVTERDRVAEVLRKAQHAESLGVLAGGVAHDFNNLLTGVLGNCSLALEETVEDSPLRELLEEIEHAAQRAAELTDQMLAYAGRVEVHRRTVVFDELVEDVLGLLASSLCRHTRVEFERPPTPVLVEADATQLRQVVLNLVSNASEALDGAAGVVNLRLSHRPGWLEFAVQDGGRGMDEATRRRVFEPFFSTKPAGRGLGLSAAQGIAAGHGGSIECSSAPGAGTTFVLSLPALETSLDPVERVRTDGAGPAAPGLILIADDQREVRDLAQRVLSAAGHRLLLASDGEEALALALEHARELDLLLLDVRMPGMPGDEVLLRLRNLNVDTPVLLSSGYGEAEVAAPLRRGAAFLKKPYRPRDLLAAVGQLLDSTVPG